MGGEAEKRLPMRQVIGYGLGHVFNDICASLWFTYLLLFLQKVHI
jgi:Na+/melibiose symporter-like transporter